MRTVNIPISTLRKKNEMIDNQRMVLSWKNREIERLQARIEELERQLQRGAGHRQD